jgi:hypothetical protein
VKVGGLANSFVQFGFWTISRMPQQSSVCMAASAGLRQRAAGFSGAESLARLAAGHQWRSAPALSFPTHGPPSGSVDHLINLA